MHAHRKISRGVVSLIFLSHTHACCNWGAHASTAGPQRQGRPRRDPGEMARSTTYTTSPRRDVASAPGEMRWRDWICTTRVRKHRHTLTQAGTEGPASTVVLSCLCRPSRCIAAAILLGKCGGRTVFFFSLPRDDDDDAVAAVSMTTRV